MRDAPTLEPPTLEPPVLEIDDLHVEAEGHPILTGLTLAVRAG